MRIVFAILYLPPVTWSSSRANKPPNGFELSRRPADTTNATAKGLPKRETLLATILDRAVGCSELLLIYS